MATGPSSPATPATAASCPRPLPPPLRGAGDRRLLLFHMAEPHRSRTPAPQQPSPAGSGAAWFTPVQQPPAAARLQHGLSPAAAAASSPSTTPAASARYAPAPRTCSQMWPKLMAGAKDGGADCIETYVFSNGQETSPGKYYFKERFNLVQFARVVKDAGLYLMLRIGLFVPAEWNFGGVPTTVIYIWAVYGAV